MELRRIGPETPWFLAGSLEGPSGVVVGLFGPRNGHWEPPGKHRRLRRSPLGPLGCPSEPETGRRGPMRGLRNGAFPVPNRFGSLVDPIHSPPIDLLSRWKEETDSPDQSQSQTRQTEPARPDRQRQTEPDRQSPDPRQTDGRPPGGLGRPAHWLGFH